MGQESPKNANKTEQTSLAAGALKFIVITLLNLGKKKDTVEYEGNVQ